MRWSGILIPAGYSLVSRTASTGAPDAVVVAPMLLTTTSRLVRGRARQLIEMREKSRCSILFHFDVPGGR